MKKRILTSALEMLLCFFVLIILSSCGNTDREDEANFVYKPYGAGYAITGYNGDVTHLKLPSEHNGIPVVRVEADAFNDLIFIKSLTVPKSITSIGSNAFGGCTNLISISLPFVGANADGTGVTYFGYIFGQSLYYNDIYANDVYYDRFTTIPKSLKNVTITDVTSISAYAFANCRSLESIKIPSNVTSIGDHAFAYCRSLESVKIPSNVTSIGSSAFSGCSSLKKITIPNKVTSIEGGVFSGCSSLKKITIPNKVTSIGSSAFSGCSSLKRITIPQNVKTIGMSAFSGCSSLTKLTFIDAEGWYCTGSSSYSEGTQTDVKNPEANIDCFTRRLVKQYWYKE